MELALVQVQNQLAHNVLDLEKYMGVLFRMRQDRDMLQVKMAQAEQ